MIVEIEYSELMRASTSLRNASRYCGEYANRLQKKVPGQLNSLTKGSSSYTNSASYFATAKIKSLEGQKQKFLDVSVKIDDLIEDAKMTDLRVASIMKREGNEFRKTNGLTYGWADGLMQALARFAIGETNKDKLSRWISAGLRDISDAINGWILDRKHWFSCEGGKYKLQVWAKRAAWVAAALAVFAACVVAFPAISTLICAILGVGSTTLSWGLAWSTFSATCTAITACIALADATVDLFTTEQACILALTDPAWAARYADISSTTELLRKSYFGSERDKSSMKWAKVLDCLKITCLVVTYGNMVKNGYLFFTGKYRANARGIKHFKVWDENKQFSPEEMLKNWKHNLKTLDYAFTHDFQYTQWVGARKRNHPTFAALEKMKDHWTYKRVMFFFDKLGDSVEWLDKHVF